LSEAGKKIQLCGMRCVQVEVAKDNKVSYLPKCGPTWVLVCSAKVLFGQNLFSSFLSNWFIFLTTFTKHTVWIYYIFRI